MKKILVIFICLIFIVGCEEEKALYRTVSAKEAYNIIDKRSDIIILDVRNESEYEAGHIEGAVNIPLNEVKSRFMEEVTDNYQSTILVYCQSGKRSKEASQIISKMGFSDVIDMGGLSSWEWSIEKSN